MDKMHHKADPPKPSTLAPGFTLGGWLPSALLPSGGTPYDPHRDGHLDLMHQAMLAAMNGVGLPSPNPNVGCLIVRDGQVRSWGGTEPYGSRHAEAVALSRLKDPAEAKGATAYVTLEPCSHHGKQPPCAQALIAAGIRECVYGVMDPHPLVAGDGLRLLEAAGVILRPGPLPLEGVAWNFPFFHGIHYQRPCVIGKWAQTLNGQLADAGGGSQWITGAEARRYVHWLRQKYDAIMVGAGTVLSDAPELTARDTYGPLRQPLKIVFDPSGRLSRSPLRGADRIEERTFAAGLPVVLVHPETQWPEWLKRRGASIYSVPVTSREDAFAALLRAVMEPGFVAWYGRPLQSILVEGGPALHNHLLATDRYDAFHVLINPSLVSADHNRVGHFPGMTPPLPFASIKSMQRHHLLQACPLGDDLLMEFVPKDRWDRVFASSGGSRS